MTTQVLQQALDMKVAELMKSVDDYAHVYAFVGDDTMPRKRKEVATALRAAITQPVQPAAPVVSPEPVAWWIPKAEQLSMSMFANKADFEAAQAAQPSQPTDAERLDFVAMSCLLLLDSTTGKPGGNGQLQVAADRKNIDAAIAANKGGDK